MRVGHFWVVGALVAMMGSARLVAPPKSNTTAAPPATPKPNHTTTAAPTPTQPHTPAPTAPSFETRCALPGIGPTDAAGYIGPFTGVRGAGYGENSFKSPEGNEDIFFVVRHEPQDSVPNKRVVGILPKKNCTVAWEFIADGSIVQSPMVDAKVVVFQTYDAPTGVAVAYGVNTTTGRAIWRQERRGITHAGCIATAVHDGRAFVMTLAKSATAQGEMALTMVAYHGESGEYLWGWDLAAGRDSGVPSVPSATTRLWVGYNAAGNRGFFGGYGSHVAAFYGATGERYFMVDLAWSQPWSVNTTLLQTTSATAEMGYVDCGESTGGDRHVVFVLTYNPAVGANVTALDQCTGGVVTGIGFATQGASEAKTVLQGSPSTSKYTPTVCFTAATSLRAEASTRVLHCFNGTTSADAPDSSAWTYEAHPGFTAMPLVGFTDPANFVLTATVDGVEGAVGSVRLGVHSQAQGHLVGMTEVKVAAEKLAAVGYAAPFESGWDLALLGVGIDGKPGGFAIVHV